MSESEKTPQESRVPGTRSEIDDTIPDNWQQFLKMTARLLAQQWRREQEPISKT
ncbi:MAG: hypothetical protein RH917_20855 [Lacipirellulaceae bacterium]